jgi:hypothetical protein
MTLYYRSADVLITDRSFTVREPHPARYAIDELALPRVVVGERHPAGRRAAFVALAALIVAAAAWPRLTSFEAHLAILAMVLLPSAVSGACIRVIPRPHELWVTYRYRQVCLFRTMDERQFGQVRRGLVRALEHRQRRFEERGGWSAHEIGR